MSNTKKLAKNTAFMYARMFLLMLITLYTSRIILQTLGVEDYGIYNVVGSIVVMFNSLRTVFSSSTQRFLNFEMGKDNHNALIKIFNLSIQSNTFIAIIFFLLVEAVGLWFLCNKINVPPGRIAATHWILQFSILSAVISIYTTTFDALIIAHERMDFYAYMSIIDGCAKLAVAYVISEYFGDRLILYGLLILSVHAVIFFFNYMFCRIHFNECRFQRTKDNAYLKRMMKFAGWNFFGNTAFALTQNGLNMVLNVFGGPIVNAARGIAVQVNNTLFQLTNNICVVIKPFMIKTYAQGDIDKMFRTIYISSKVFFIVQLYIVLVFSFYAKEIIHFWLGSTPAYVVNFLIIILWHSIIRSLHGPIDLLFYSVGNLKKYQICECIVLSLPLLVSLMALSHGMNFYSVFIIQLIFEVINFVIILILAKRICNLPLGDYQKNVLVPFLVITCTYAFGFYLYHEYTLASFGKLCTMIGLATMFAILMLTLGINKFERDIIKSMIKNK